MNILDKWKSVQSTSCVMERFLASGLDCLELRRLRYDLTFTYKLLSNKLHTDKDGNMITSSFPALIDIDVDSLFSFNSYFNTRGHVCKLANYQTTLKHLTSIT